LSGVIGRPTRIPYRHLCVQGETKRLYWKVRANYTNGIVVDSWAKLFQTVQVPSSRTVPSSAFAATEQASSSSQAGGTSGGAGQTPQHAAAPHVDSTEFGLWCMRTTLGVIEAIYNLASKRAQELERHTGQKLIITYPAEAPSPQLVYAAREMHFMKFSLAGTDVHVYSARNPNKLPAIHFVGEAGSFTSGSDRGGDRNGSPRDLSRQRVVSNLLCRVADTGNGGYALVAGKDGSAIKMDDLVFSIFQALLKQQQLNRRR
jgi:hypothetical protein